jgi:mono/diheme cytochrome c family protein
MRSLFGTAVLAVFLFPLSAFAGETGDLRAGHSFASANCGACHAIEANENKSPSLKAPSFASVANTPGMTGRALAVWLQTSHPTMPNFLVARKDRDNIIAYIMSLRPPETH